MRNHIAGFVAVAFLLAGCSDQNDQPASGGDAVPTSPAPTAPAPSASSVSASDIGQIGAYGMPKLADELNCVACHRIDVKLVGPAWKDVSAKYKGATTFNYNGKDYPLQEGLVMKVSKGGSGHWGSMPMPANDPSGTKKDKIEQLVKFVLGLAK